MMADGFVMYDEEGALRMVGQLLPGDDPAEPPAGWGAMIVPQAIIQGYGADLEKARKFWETATIASAEAVRATFLTPGSGKAQSYQQKRIEAHAFVDDPATSNVVVLAAEALATGKTLASLVAEVLAMEVIGIQGEALVNAAEMGARKGIAEAENWKQLHEGASVDWQAVAGSIVALMPG